MKQLRKYILVMGCMADMEKTIQTVRDKTHCYHFMGCSFRLAAMGRRIDPSWGGPIELFLNPPSAPRLV